MKVLIVTSSPNAAGLTAACGEAARHGIVDGHSPARVVSLNGLEVARCAVCGDGWGTCRSEHRCSIDDDFQSLHESFRQAEACVFVTPVYFGEPSEALKATFDRLRRCEATRKDEPGAITGKPVVAIAAAGGSGRGAVHCLAEMERVLTALGAELFDTIAVTQKTRDYQLETVHDALVALVSARPSAPSPSHEGRRPSRPARGRRRR